MQNGDLPEKDTRSSPRPPSMLRSHVHPEEFLQEREKVKGQSWGPVQGEGPDGQGGLVQ